MNYPWIDEYLLSMKGVTKNYQADWRWERYYVGDKMFAAVCLDGDMKPYYITLKLPPEESEVLRGQYEDIIPGYYCNKLHWSSVRPCGAVPQDVMRTMLEHAYQTGFRALTKKKQREIAEPPAT